MANNSKQGLYDHLISKGLDPDDAVWGSILDITYLIPTFISSGGTYSNPTDEERPATNSHYPTPMMKVSYGDSWYLLTKEVRNGYPVIWLMHMGDVWYPYLVHPDHLDTALCYLLSVDNTTGSGGILNHGA